MTEKQATPKLLASRRRENAERLLTEIAILIPCYNEELTISQVVSSFRLVLPQATIYVYDNNSQDETKERARVAGALVRSEALQGKGNVVRRMFADVEADIYLLVDGDNTYDAAAAPIMVQTLLDKQLDMVNGRRISAAGGAYRFGHQLGNRVLTALVAKVFGEKFTDMLSGYRVFSRRFVKSFPALASGFEIETELTVHALELRMPIIEIGTPYESRPSGSKSKLRTYRDGWRILTTIVYLIKEERPLQFFGGISILLAMISIVISIPLFTTYVQTGLVPRFPTAILATGIMLLCFLSLTAGLILDTITLGRREVKRMRYLEIPAPGQNWRALDERPVTGLPASRPNDE